MSEAVTQSVAEAIQQESKEGWEPSAIDVVLLKYDHCKSWLRDALLSGTALQEERNTLKSAGFEPALRSAAGFFDEGWDLKCSHVVVTAELESKVHDAVDAAHKAAPRNERGSNTVNRNPIVVPELKFMSDASVELSTWELVACSAQYKIAARALEQPEEQYGERCMEVEGSPLGASVHSVPASMATSISMDWSVPPSPEDDVDFLVPSLFSQAVDELRSPGPPELEAAAALREAGAGGIDFDELAAAEVSTASLLDAQSVDFFDLGTSSARLPPRPASAGGSLPSRQPAAAAASAGASRFSASSSPLLSAQERRPSSAASLAASAEGAAPPG
ncbi:unnamed protein product, partial [Prorocentrum cordatum]